MSKSYKKVVVIIPTYNESDNISRLLRKIFYLYPGIKVTVVDDLSPDGTSLKVSNLKRNYPDLSIITRVGKGGRGSAVLEGFKSLLNKSGVEYAIEMDADFSHDPQEISKLVSLADHSDVVIGSRYLPSSKIINWPLSRRIFSRMANWYARLILGVPISDYTNGYRCYRLSALRLLNFQKIRFGGYVVLSEIAYQLKKKGCSFKETPIVFVNRRRGESNLRPHEIKEALLSILALRINWLYLSSRNLKVALVTALFLLALATRLPLYKSAYLSPDAVEYLNIAQNLSEGQGPTLSIKWHYFDEKPLVHSDIGERPIMFPILAAPIIKIFGSWDYVQLMLLIIGSANVVLFYFLGKLIIGSSYYAYLTSVLVAINPGMIVTSKFLWAEQVYIFFLLSSLLVYFKSKLLLTYVFSGVLLSLSFLARQEGLIVFLLIFLFLMLKREFKKIAFVMLGFAPLSFIYFLANIAVNGNPFFSVDSYHFRVLSFQDGMWWYKSKINGDVVNFISRHIPEILNEIKFKFVNYIKEFFSRSELYLLGLGFIFLRIRSIDSKYFVILPIALLSFIISPLIWSFQGESLRFLLPAYLISMTLIATGFRILYSRSSSKLRPWAVLLGLVVVLLTGQVYFKTDFAYYSLAPYEREHFANRYFDSSYEWIKKNTGLDSVVASSDPWTLYVETRRPSQLFPNITNQVDLMQLLDKYHTQYILISKTATKFAPAIVDQDFMNKILPSIRLGLQTRLKLVDIGSDSSQSNFFIIKVSHENE